MGVTLDQAIRELKRLEPVFIAAGDLAADMQQEIIQAGRHHQKLATGNAAIDIVSEVDFLSQEMILSQLAKTPLSDCRLFAEEDTALTEVFAKDAPFTITLDPLDGTKRFTEGGKIFSVVIQLHDQERPRYTFIYYPRLRYWMRMDRDKQTASGPVPRDIYRPVAPRTIVATSILYDDGPPPPVLAQLEGQGYELQTSGKIGPGLGSNWCYLQGDVAGYFSQSRNVYDGGVACHAAYIRGHKIFKRGFDLASIKMTDRGALFTGFILALDPKHIPQDLQKKLSF